LSKSVVIIGGGIIGLCSALYARRNGMEVTVVDREPKGHHGCSFGNAGMVVPSHFIPLAAPGMVGMGIKMLFNPEGPFAIKPSLNKRLLRWGWLFMRAANEAHVKASGIPLRDLHLLSRRLYEELADESGDAFGLHQRGLLMLCKSQKTLNEEAHVAGQANDLGLHAKVVDAKALAELDPTITMDVAGAIHFEDDCHLTPGSLLDWLRHSLEAEGVVFRDETEIVDFAMDGPWIRSVETRTEKTRADQFVLATGAWSGELAERLRLKIPMQAGKGYSVTLNNPPQLPGICSILTEARVAITPMGSSLRIGGTMELTGNDLSINRKRLGGIFKSVPQYFPEFKTSDFEGQEVWSGLRPCSPDGLPYLGRSARVQNLVVATGHSMMGVSLAPATGKLVSQLLLDQETTLNLDAFNPNRFDLND